MASSARSEADCEEFFDDPETLRAKIKQLAALVRSSKHFCALTGAGISTSAGIADFRSGLNTSLATGAGKWAKEAAIQQGKGAQIKNAKVATRVVSALPTKAHMSLVSLMRSEPNYLKYLVSTNCDGLHRRSGIPVDRLSEVHGNSFLEACNICSTGYFRDYRVSNKGQKGKQTGRKCTVPNCNGDLCKTVVAFNQHCPKQTIKRTWQHINQCDVLLALGTSLTVSTVRALCYEIVHERHQRAKKAKQKERHHLLRDDPRARRHNADAKKTPERERHLVVVNIQKTVFDDLCTVRIFAKIDDVMVGLMKELELDVPTDDQWRLQRFLRLCVAPKSPEMAGSAPSAEEDVRRLSVSAMDVDGTSHTVFKNVKLRNDGEAIAEVTGTMTPSQRRCQEMFEFDIPALSTTSEVELKIDHDEDAEADDAENLPSPVHRRPKDDESPSPNAKAMEKEQVENEAEVDEKEDAAERATQGAARDNGLVLSLGFFGHYGEPRLRIRLNEFLSGIGEEGGEVVCRLRMNVTTKEWTVERIEFVPEPVGFVEKYSFTKKGKKSKANKAKK